MNWTTTIYYAENGIDHQQVFNAPHLPRVGDNIIAMFSKEVKRIMFTVESITFSNMSYSIIITLKP
jgi:hypothetical protein